MMRAVCSFVVLCAVAAAGCRDSTEPVPIPMPVAPATIVENYTGTLFVSGTNLHSFEVRANGEVYATLTAIATVPVEADPAADPPVAASPSSPVTFPITITIGQPTLTTLGVQCSRLKTVEAPAGPNPQVSGQALSGTFCVSIADTNGSLPRAATYTITVRHS